jgi:hypothetical protein
MTFHPVLLIALSAIPLSTGAQTEPVTLTQRTTGDPQLAAFTVDTAPGAVSALGLIGMSGDQLTVIENPRDFTVALKALDGKNALGLSITPARTSLLPMNVSTYDANWWARVLAGTTFAYAQSTAQIDGADYRQRAVSVETSFFLQPAKDDPLIVYWNLIKRAGNTGDDNDPCLFSGPQLPNPNTPAPASPAPGRPAIPATAGSDVKTSLDERAKQCRAKAMASARWNASRVWASWATGSYRPDAGGGSHSLGRALVLGGTYGIGDVGATTAVALTLAAKRTWHEPTLSTFGSPNPVRKSTTLGTLRGSFGSSRLRGVVEASRFRDGDPTASERTFKRALGLDVRVAEGMWLNFRAGKQRRIDNSGDESGSSISLSYSPSALLKLGGT